MVIYSISHLSTNLRSSLVFPSKYYPVMGNVSERNQPSSAKRVAVVGAGVSGLAAAYKLKSNGLNVTLYEADSRAGGKLKTVVKDGLIWDEGANTMTESEEEVTSLFDDLKLREKLQLLPSNPIALLQSNILSAQSKLQIMLEPFLWKKHIATQDSDDHAHESVGEFFERHFGKEFVDYVIDPFVAGTSGGDPQSLSMRHAFPDLWNIENRFGSVIAGFFQSKLSSKKEKRGGSNKKPRVRGSFSFQGGMQTLVDTMCTQFGKDELKLQCKVLSLSHSPNENPSSENWSVSSMSNNNIQDQQYDAVIVTNLLPDDYNRPINNALNPCPYKSKTNTTNSTHVLLPLREKFSTAEFKTSLMQVLGYDCDDKFDTTHHCHFQLEFKARIDEITESMCKNIEKIFDNAFSRFRLELGLIQEGLKEEERQGEFASPEEVKYGVVGGGGWFKSAGGNHGSITDDGLVGGVHNKFERSRLGNDLDSVSCGSLGGDFKGGGANGSG
uniref:Protoporphyrinogen oxidase n=1 Tax=Chenopodium quinoa TaxID=63459 RepID=A0A803LSR2_CHEQI